MTKRVALNSSAISKAQAVRGIGRAAIVNGWKNVQIVSVTRQRGGFGIILDVEPTTR